MRNFHVASPHRFVTYRLEWWIDRARIVVTGLAADPGDWQSFLVAAGKERQSTLPKSNITENCFERYCPLGKRAPWA